MRRQKVPEPTPVFIVRPKRQEGPFGNLLNFAIFLVFAFIIYNLLFNRSPDVSAPAPIAAHSQQAAP